MAGEYLAYDGTVFSFECLALGWEDGLAGCSGLDARHGV